MNISIEKLLLTIGDLEFSRRMLTDENAALRAEVEALKKPIVLESAAEQPAASV